MRVCSLDKTLYRGTQRRRTKGMANCKSNSIATAGSILFDRLPGQIESFAFFFFFLIFHFLFSCRDAVFLVVEAMLKGISLSQWMSSKYSSRKLGSSTSYEDGHPLPGQNSKKRGNDCLPHDDCPLGHGRLLQFLISSHPITLNKKERKSFPFFFYFRWKRRKPLAIQIEHYRLCRSSESQHRSKNEGGGTIDRELLDIN